MAKPAVTARTRRSGAISKNTTVKQSGKIVLEKDHTDNIPSEEELGAHPAYVRVEGKITRNLGDYNSASVGVSIMMPAVATQEGVEKMYVTVSDIVDELLDRELKMAKGEQV